ncbi:MAG: UDP-N-acetylmuramate--L-alanine ligase [Paludibacteraceae bacterium]|nr:UDP-N-acetylmuramate--L-alanine ligase [Paludibacteraceae bacterium]
MHRFYFLGIGGIGMSALARYFAAKGYDVSGYDRTASPLTKELEAEGIAVQYDDSLDAVKGLDKEATIVVRTPAVSEDAPVYVWLRENGFTIKKRAEVLGMVTRSARALCVAGTHGKTTTSTMLAHILHSSHVGANAFLGGIANNYHSNLLLDAESNLVVVEADEFDRSFHHLRPYMSVITSMDADHLDIYGTEEAYRASFAQYAGLVEEALVVKGSLKFNVESLRARVYTYAVGDKADFYADNVVMKDGAICFDFHHLRGMVQGVRLGVPAWVNIENSVAAMAVAHLMGATDDELREGVESFAGVYRRFNVHVNTPQVAYVDDYAHHPEELRASIESVRRLYPDRHVIGVFQPHLFSRTHDLADGFAQVLGRLDEVVLLPIYPARELPIEGVTSEWLLGKITMEKGKQKALVERELLAGYLRGRVDEQVGKACVVVTMGAGDIDRLVNDIKETLIYEKNG